jgi:ParB family chromosome partitioning protein
MQIELHQLELRYERLRVHDSARLGRLVGLLDEQGQHTPVLVVPEGARYVLIDGYLRVKALRKLGLDTVDAVVLPLSEADALLYGYCQQSQARRCALEEAWLLDELSVHHGLSQAQLAVRLGRSVSWVCRRLALVRELPEPVQQLVRMGYIGPQGAMKYLVPLSRGKKSDCLLLIQGLGRHKVSERQLQQLYLAWRRAEHSQWLRIASDPLLYLKANAALQPDATDSAQHSQLDLVQRQLRRDMHALRGICRRLQGSLLNHGLTAWLLSPSVRSSFAQAEQAFVGLQAMMEGRLADLRDTQRHPAPVRQGCQSSAHCPAAEHQPQLGQEGAQGQDGSSAAHAANPGGR